MLLGCACHFTSSFRTCWYCFHFFKCTGNNNDKPAFVARSSFPLPSRPPHRRCLCKHPQTKRRQPPRQRHRCHHAAPARPTRGRLSASVAKEPSMAEVWMERGHHMLIRFLRQRRSRCIICNDFSRSTPFVSPNMSRLWFDSIFSKNGLYRAFKKLWWAYIKKLILTTTLHGGKCTIAKSREPDSEVHRKRHTTEYNKRKPNDKTMSKISCPLWHLVRKRDRLITPILSTTEVKAVMTNKLCKKK